MSRKFYSLLLLFLIISSCKKDKEVEKSAQLLFEKSSMVRKTGKNCDTAAYDCSIITLDVVRAKPNSEVSRRINNGLDKHLISLITTEEDPEIQNLSALSEKFLRDYREAAQNFSEEPPWEAYVKEQIYLQNEDLISIGVTTEIFSGGAHGYKTLTFVNIDPRTGNILSTEDLFEPGFKEYVEQRFRTEQGIPEGDPINSTGFWFEGETFHLPENIGFTQDKVVLIYNSYEIAPYAAGDIVLEIPIQEVASLIKIE